MPDEAPVLPDTPDTSAPTGTPDINWEQRYNDLRPQFDRTAQEAAQLRAERERLQTDEDYQRQLLQELGWQVEEPDPGFVDPTDTLRRELDELKSWRDQTTQQAQQAQQLQTIERSVSEQFRATAPDLDEATREWVTTRALNMDARDDGMPDIAGAYQAFVDWETARQKQWSQTKRSPRIAPGGSAATQAPNLDDREARVAHMAAQLSAMDD